MSEDEEDKYEEVNIKNPDEDEEMEVEVTEISLNEDEINYWISELEELRENKSGDISLPLDDESELVVSYDDSETEDEEDENSSGPIVEFEEVDDENDEETDDDEDEEESEGEE